MNPLKTAFEQAAEQNYWSNEESLSGPGSNMEQTRVIRQAIPLLLKKYAIKSLLDAPCGDLFWMKTILPALAEAGIQYHGADIVHDLVQKNTRAFQSFKAVFYELDLTKDTIPKVDLIFTRDCFIHLSYENIYAILKNYRASGAKYLLASTYTKPTRKNHNVDGFFLWGRMLNMQRFPFYFVKPVDLIIEACTENEGIYDDKSLGLWEIKRINLAGIACCIFLLRRWEAGVSMSKSTMVFLRRVKNYIGRKLPQS